MSTYTAVTDAGLQDRSFRGDAYTSEAAAAPDSAIWKRDWAEKTSSAVKRIMLMIRPTHDAGVGNKEKSGSRRGAYILLA